MLNALSFQELLVIGLFGAMLLYTKIADRFNIIDKPNERSSHSDITIRGGGIIFVVAGLAYAIYTHFALPFFWLGFLLISVVSFVDDIKTLSSKVRLPVHFLAIGLLIFQALQTDGAWYIWLIALVLATGILNAYNFMDGINGITAGYSFVVLLSLLLLNFKFPFAEPKFIVTFITAVLVFGFFNFRKRAKCFAGDVGSVSMAFAIIFLMFQLILNTQNLYFILLLAVYGVDSVLTILYRIRKKENIFEAHRSHLYQWLVRPGPFSHLQVSGIYMVLQLAIAVLVIRTSAASATVQLAISALVLGVLAIAYVVVKQIFKKKYNIV